MATAIDVELFYLRYLSCCNQHRFEDLSEFVHDDVVVNDGQQTGLGAYAAGLQSVTATFPDYHWDLRHLLIDPPHISAHFRDTGTHRGTFLGTPATGRFVTTQEFAHYRLRDGKIAEVWVTADMTTLLDQLH